MTDSTMKFLEASAYNYMNDRINFYESNPGKAPITQDKTPPAVLRMTNTRTQLAIKVVERDIPIFEFKVFKKRLFDRSGMEIYYTVLCQSERIDSQSEALIMQKMNRNDLLEQFVIAKLDDKLGKPAVTVVYQLTGATILDMTCGGIYTGIVATSTMEKIQYITDLGTIETTYDSSTGRGT